MSDLATVAPAFVDMAHRIVWCTVGHHRRRPTPHPHPAPHLGVGRQP